MARVLGIDLGGVRADTPLSTLGWDSLARVCWEEAVADAGHQFTAVADAKTVGDLMNACSPKVSGS